MTTRRSTQLHLSQRLCLPPRVRCLVERWRSNEWRRGKGERGEREEAREKARGVNCARSHNFRAARQRGFVSISAALRVERVKNRHCVYFPLTLFHARLIRISPGVFEFRDERQRSGTESVPETKQPARYSSNKLAGRRSWQYKAGAAEHRKEGTEGGYGSGTGWNENGSRMDEG